MASPTAAATLAEKMTCGKHVRSPFAALFTKAKCSLSLRHGLTWRNQLQTVDLSP